jgi:hypothetical protein
MATAIPVLVVSDEDGVPGCLPDMITMEELKTAVLDST